MVTQITAVFLLFFFALFELGINYKENFRFYFRICITVLFKKRRNFLLKISIYIILPMPLQNNIMLFYLLIPVAVLLLFLPINFFARAEKEGEGIKISLYLYRAVLLFRAAYFIEREGITVVKGKKVKVIPYKEMLKPDTKNLYLMKALSIKQIKVFTQVPLIKTKSVLPAFSLLTAANALSEATGGKVQYSQQYTLFEEQWEATGSFSTSIAKIILTIIKKVIKNGR